MVVKSKWRIQQFIYATFPKTVVGLGNGDELLMLGNWYDKPPKIADLMDRIQISTDPRAEFCSLPQEDEHWCLRSPKWNMTVFGAPPIPYVISLEQTPGGLTVKIRKDE